MTALFASVLPPLPACTVVCCGIDLHSEAQQWHDAALAGASSAERLHAARCRHAMDATRHLAGRALVRAMLVRELGLQTGATEFCVNQWGKPLLPDSGIEFSIAHAGDIVVAAFCRRCPVGVDIEQADADADVAAMASIFHPAERAALLALPEPQARLALQRCWTRKEAVIKALGEGFSRPLDSFIVSVGEQEHDWLLQAPDSAESGRRFDWSVAGLPQRPGYHGSVVAMGPGLPVLYYPPLIL